MKWHLQTSNLRIPEKNLWKAWWCIGLLPQDPGSERTQRTSTESAALLPSPAVGAEVDTWADPQPFFTPLSSCGHPAPSLPLPLSLSASLPSLAPYTKQDHNVPVWLMVTMMLMASSHPHLSASMLLYLLPFYHSAATIQRHQRTPLQPAENCFTTTREPAPQLGYIN